MAFCHHPVHFGSSFTVCVLLTMFACDVFQARQVLEREFNNLLALGTDRRLEEVEEAQAAALNKWNIVERGATVWPHFPPCPCRVGMTSLFDALHRGARGFGRVREGRGWAWWQAPWKHCLLDSACHPCPCHHPHIWCLRNSSSLKVRYNTNKSPTNTNKYLCISLCFCGLLFACPGCLTACCVLSVPLCQTSMCHIFSSSSLGAPETRPLSCADLLMLTYLCLLTGALMLTGKMTKNTT